MQCFRWTGEECKYKPHHKECKGDESTCVVIHNPFAMLDAMQVMYKEVSK